MYCEFPFPTRQSFHVYWQNYNCMTSIRRVSFSIKRAADPVRTGFVPIDCCKLPFSYENMQQLKKVYTQSRNRSYMIYIKVLQLSQVKTIFQYDLVMIGLPAFHHSLEGWQSRCNDIFWLQGVAQSGIFWLQGVAQGDFSMCLAACWNFCFDKVISLYLRCRSFKKIGLNLP